VVRDGESAGAGGAGRELDSGRILPILLVLLIGFPLIAALFGSMMGSNCMLVFGGSPGSLFETVLA